MKTLALVSLTACLAFASVTPAHADPKERPATRRKFDIAPTTALKLGQQGKPKAPEEKPASAPRSNAAVDALREGVDAAKKAELEGQAREKESAPYSAIRAKDAYENASNQLSQLSARIDDLARTSGGAPAPRALKADADALWTKLEADLARIRPRADHDWDVWEADFKRSVTGVRSQVLAKKGLPTWWTDSDYADPQKRLDAALSAPVWGYRSNSCEVQYEFANNAIVGTTYDPPFCR